MTYYAQNSGAKRYQQIIRLIHTRTEYLIKTLIIKDIRSAA